MERERKPIAVGSRSGLPSLWQGATPTAQESSAYTGHDERSRDQSMRREIDDKKAVCRQAPRRGERRALPRATSDTASLLDRLPGVSLYGAGGVSSLPAIRGLADDRIRIKVDGMDLISSCANHMNPPLSYIDPTNVGSVTLFAGITPVSVGGDSIAGTILVNSPAPEFARAGEGKLVKGQAGAFYRSNGNGRGANLSATLANEMLSVNYSGSTAQADNYGPAAVSSLPDRRWEPAEWLAGDEVGSSSVQVREPVARLRVAPRGASARAQVRLPAHSLPGLSERAHGHDRQRQPAGQRFAISGSTTGVRWRRAPITTTPATR
jgi:outer membrane receptor protein involved in Fe transport